MLEDGKVISQYPVSTALKGTGCSQDSYQTPTGLHQITEKIGDNELVGAVFRGREVTGEVASIESQPVDTGQDLITTRILWLSGMEPGINQGDGVDSHDRYISVHQVAIAMAHGPALRKPGSIDIEPVAQTPRPVQCSKIEQLRALCIAVIDHISPVIEHMKKQVTDQRRHP